MRLALNDKRNRRAIEFDSERSPYLRDIVDHDHSNSNTNSHTFGGFSYTTDTRLDGMKFLTYLFNSQVKKIDVF
jgi:hypothetical protein